MVVLFITTLIYYSIFSQQTDQLVESQSKEINKQIVFNYESYINSVIETANYVQSAALNSDLLYSYDELQNLYQVNSEIKRDVVAIFLFNTKGNKLLGNEISEGRTSYIVSEPWLINAFQEETIFHFSAPHRNSVSRNENDLVISVSKSTEYLKNGIRKKGVLLIELNFNAITDLAQKTNLGDGGHILILNDNDSLIYSSAGNKDILESKAIAISRFFGGFKAELNGREMYFNINTLSQTRWRIVSIIDVDDIAQAKNRMLLILLIIFIAAFIMTTLAAVLLSLRISRPLKILRQHMRQVEMGELDKKLEITGQKELVLVAHYMNNMMARIKALMDEVVSEQRAKRKNELAALQNQINPHFLYNTLDSIVWLAENERSEDVITTVIALARFFRISISRGANFIPVKDEISHIRNYLTIQKIRYLDKFEYEFEIDKSIYSYKVMKLILQPLVENALYHGIGDEQELITIRGYQRDKMMIFEVENTGYGIDKEKINEILKKVRSANTQSSVGIRNVYQRLTLYYGDKADLEIHSQLDEMTLVRLLIPLPEEEDNKK